MNQLKQLLLENGIKQSFIAEKTQIGTSALNLLINKAVYPKRIPADSVNMRIINCLTEQGIDKSTITQVMTEHRLQAYMTSKPLSETIKEEVDMFIQPQALTPEARKHFGLFSNPFNQDVTSNEQMYQNDNNRHIRMELIEAAKNSGFKAIIGESGSGKTTIREDFIENIEAKGEPYIIIQPSINCSADSINKGKVLKAGDIEEAILTELDPTARPRRSTQARSKQIKDLLESSCKAGYGHLLIIEEAHSLSTHTLRHLKRFHETKLGRKRLLGIVLIGQPELAQKLSPKKAEVREVVQRCEIINLQPLHPTEIADYLSLKLRHSHCKLNKIIDESGIEAIAKKLIINTHPDPNKNKVISMLYPLALNNLMTKAMNETASIGVPVINADLINNL